MTDCSPLDATLLRILMRDGPVVFEEIAARLGETPSIISARLDALRDAGRVWYTPRQGWHIKERL